MSTKAQIDREKRSILFRLRKGAAAQWQILAGYTSYGYAIRLEALHELIAEKRIERGPQFTLRLVKS